MSDMFSGFRWSFDKPRAATAPKQKVFSAPSMKIGVLSRTLARNILMKRGKKHYPNEDYDVIIQHIMDDYDPENHFDEQMNDFLRNHPEYAPYRLLFIHASEIRAVENHGKEDAKAERMAWLEQEAEDGEFKDEAKKMIQEIVIDEAAIDAIVELLQDYNPPTYGFDGVGLSCLGG